MFIIGTPMINIFFVGTTKELLNSYTIIQCIKNTFGIFFCIYYCYLNYYHFRKRVWITLLGTNNVLYLIPLDLL